LLPLNKSNEKYARIFRYLQPFKTNIGLYLLFSVLSIVFSLVSFGAVPFFIKMIFTPDKIAIQAPKNVFSLEEVNYQLSLFIQQHGSNGPLLALGIICVLIIASTFLKLFLLLVLLCVIAHENVGGY